MGRFNDLPKELMWLILRIPIKHRINGDERKLKVYESPFNGYVNLFGSVLSTILCNFALISRRCLKIVKSKTLFFRPPLPGLYLDKTVCPGGAWLFEKGALTC